MAKKMKSTKRSGRKDKHGKEFTFSRYIFRVLKQIHGDVSISQKGMKIMNNFINDTFERIASEGMNLMNINKEKSLTSRTVQNAVKLVIPGELVKHSISEGVKAVFRHDASLRSQWLLFYFCRSTT